MVGAIASSTVLNWFLRCDWTKALSSNLGQSDLLYLAATGSGIDFRSGSKLQSNSMASANPERPLRYKPHNPSVLTANINWFRAPIWENSPWQDSRTTVASLAKD